MVLRCDECEKRVTRDGYIKIDREAIARNAVAVGDWEVIDPDTDRVYWKILHPDCDTNAKPTDFRLAARKLPTENDLLQCTAWLLRNQPELVAASNWHGLIGRILADTGEYADWLASPERAEQNAARKRRADRRKRELDDNPDDPRHGTLTGYQCGCKCDRCKAANAEQSRRDRTNANGHNERELTTAGQRR
ncbi:hypothetical protein C3477_23265 [Mycobacterium kansasii]|nr:hypothetical protein C3B43_20245 [Mycobacterium kansasii]POX98793.1 hypothetical protein C3477_23265 [Mycobacterium kansasii]POY16399.1 hypothetical protein C3476_22840 [Mycobacterium kansasii]